MLYCAYSGEDSRLHHFPAVKASLDVARTEGWGRPKRRERTAGSNNYLRLAAEAGIGVFEASDPWQEPFGDGYENIDYTRVDM